MVKQKFKHCSKRSSDNFRIKNQIIPKDYTTRPNYTQICSETRVHLVPHISGDPMC